MTINYYANGAQKDKGENLTSDLLFTKAYRYLGTNWSGSTGVPDYVGSTSTWDLTKEGYKQIYLNTHRYLDSALPFWSSLGYVVTIEEDDYDETNHMIKIID